METDQKDRNGVPIFFDAFLAWFFPAGHIAVRTRSLHQPHPKGHWRQVSTLTCKAQPPGMTSVIFATLVPLPRQDIVKSDVSCTLSPHLGEFPPRTGGEAASQNIWERLGHPSLCPPHLKHLSLTDVTEIE